VLDAPSPAAAVAEIAQPLFGLKAGRETFKRPLPTVFHPPAAADNHPAK